MNRIALVTIGCALTLASAVAVVNALADPRPLVVEQPRLPPVGHVMANVSLPLHTPARLPDPDPGVLSREPDVLRGAYLARVGDCAACHTAPGGKSFAGGLPLDSPIGAIYSTNITPDKRNGIGDWTYEDFERLMRRGITREGFTVYPAMPYPSYSRLSDADLKDLYAYFMRGVPAVGQENRRNDIPWPLSMRWPLAIWRMMFAPAAEPFQPPAGMDAQTARGAYLVEGLGHCGSCHTPRGMTMAEVALSDTDGTRYLSGGQVIDGWTAPSLRNEHGGGLADWSEADIVELLRTGRNARAASFGGMNEVIQRSMQYLTDSDLAAIGKYLKTLAPNNNAPPYVYDPTIAQQLFEGRPPSAAAQLYLDRCAACHRSNGTGMGKAFPPLAGNPVLQTADPNSAIRMILTGGSQAATHGAPSSLTMGSYLSLLDDQQVADLATFIQQSWGNKGGGATPAQVAKLRRNSQAVAPAAPVGSRP